MKKQNLKILVPIDFKEASINGLMTAIEIAKMKSGELTLFHVKSNVQHMINRGYSGFGEHSEAYKLGEEELSDENHKTKMELESLARNYGVGKVPVSTYVGAGYYKDQLEKYLSNHQVDLLVMGTSGQNSLAELFTGTKAEQSIRLSKVPVLAVKKFHKPEELKNLLLGIELREYDQEIINAIKQIPDYLEMNVFIVYVKHSKFEESEEVLGFLENFTKKHDFKNYKLEVLPEGDTQKKLEDFAQKNDIDIIATITKGERGIFKLIYGSHTEGLLDKSTESVLTIKR